ncbi:Polygalacturonase [Quillaja saponaria]|uniref:Polygalacturonase n=1 Tax=Quillaja saponaria TaxID=32244 RepID=A0AAD7LLR8_QUISA|nr:Polygalacturonase [Quillaja saponaria]
MKMSKIATFFYLFLLASIANAQSGVFDITKYGGHADADITQALTSAWKEACALTTPSKVVVPAGTYKLNVISFQGPCKGKIDFQLDGTVQAPADPAQVKTDGSWITFEHVDHLTILGKGVFDGQGATAWNQNNCGKNPDCEKTAMNLGFNFLTNSIIRDVTSKDSKNFHVNVLGGNNVTFDHFTVSAPETSLNTDGIHIGRSIGINVINTNIATGDDCISLGDGNKNITVTGVTCGPGHGISVGSLGRYNNEEPVEGIIVKNCTIKNTSNGVRIKTWPHYPVTGSATDMHFEDIIMDNVGNPVLIDQEYCPWNQCNRALSSKIKISKVSFKNIRGTSSTKQAVKLACSKGIPCEGVELADIDLTFSGGPATSACTNVKPIITGKQNPPACTAAPAPTS